MSYTMGCNEDHGSYDLGFRIALAMAADAGEETWAWDWPYHTDIQP